MIDYNVKNHLYKTKFSLGFTKCYIFHNEIKKKLNTDNSALWDSAADP